MLLKAGSRWTECDYIHFIDEEKEIPGKTSGCTHRSRKWKPKGYDFQSHLANTPFSALCPNRNNTSNVWKLTVQKPCSQSVLKSTKNTANQNQSSMLWWYPVFLTPSQLHLLSAGLETLNGPSHGVHPGASSPLKLCCLTTWQEVWKWTKGSQAPSPSSVAHNIMSTLGRLHHTGKSRPGRYQHRSWAALHAISFQGQS